jgi:hypothetical protein
VIVQRGTNAGVKPPPKPRPTERWRCACLGRDDDERILRENAPYLVRCPDCGTTRP